MAIIMILLNTIYMTALENCLIPFGIFLFVNLCNRQLKEAHNCDEGKLHCEFYVF